MKTDLFQFCGHCWVFQICWPWCWERLKAGGEEDDRGWDGWMALPTRWTWVWVNSGIWRWTRRPGVLKFMGSQRVRHYWVTELNWTELKTSEPFLLNYIWGQLKTDCIFFFFLTSPRGIWDLRSLTRNQTCAPWIGWQSLNHWTSGEVLSLYLYNWFFKFGRMSHLSPNKLNLVGIIPSIYPNYFDFLIISVSALTVPSSCGKAAN